MNLTGKAALITGGARIGRAVAEEFARRGCRVAVTYRSSRKSALETVASLRKLGGEATALRCDVTNEKDVRAAVAHTVRAFGSLDIVINMASIYGRTPYARLTRKDWDANLNANLTSAHLVVLHAAPHLKRRGGRVVNIADWVAASGRPQYKSSPPYSPPNA